jgi:hypothetical protein
MVAPAGAVALYDSQVSEASMQPAIVAPLPIIPPDASSSKHFSDGRHSEVVSVFDVKANPAHVSSEI